MQDRQIVGHVAGHENAAVSALHGRAIMLGHAMIVQLDTRLGQIEALQIGPAPGSDEDVIENGLTARAAAPG